ncbi:MAG: hypothetical protein U0325_32320 [Polyangiales bacterium]
MPDVDRTEFLLMLGANPAASNGSIMSLGDVRGRLKGLRERGARFELVDPQRETARWATKARGFIRPGGDAAYLLAVLHALRRGARAARGLPGATPSARPREAVRPFSPARVWAPRWASPPRPSRRPARDFAAARRAVAYGRIGVCQDRFGTASALLEALNASSRGISTTAPAAPCSHPRGRHRLARTRHRRQPLRPLALPRLYPRFGGNLPASVIAEEIETGSDGQIRGFVTVAGNPVSSVPDGAHGAGLRLTGVHGLGRLLHQRDRLCRT